MRGPVLFVVALGLGVACRGPHLEPQASKTAGSNAIPVVASTSASVHDPDETLQAVRWVNAAFGCFSGGSWMEATGSIGEERTLATVSRCRLLMTEVLGKKLDDDAALASVRAIEPAVVDALVAAVEKSAPPKRRAELVAVVRLYCDAAREALNARKAADAARQGKPLDEAAVTAKDALAKLYASKNKRARVASLVLAADHLESARGLDSKGKALTASPTFDVIFGVPRMDAWSPYALATAKAAGHPVTKDDDAIPAIATAFAERFEAVANDLRASEAREVAEGYAKRLREELAAKSK
jgi:hypothetical protein